MKRLLLLLPIIVLVSCQHEHHVKAQITFQTGQKDTVEYTYWDLVEQEVDIDKGDVFVHRNGTLASGARSFKLLKP